MQKTSLLMKYNLDFGFGEFWFVNFREKKSCVPASDRWQHWQVGGVSEEFTSNFAGNYSVTKYN